MSAPSRDATRPCPSPPWACNLHQGTEWEQNGVNTTIQSLGYKCLTSHLTLFALRPLNTSFADLFAPPGQHSSGEVLQRDLGCVGKVIKHEVREAVKMGVLGPNRTLGGQQHCLTAAVPPRPLPPLLVVVRIAGAWPVCPSMCSRCDLPQSTITRRHIPWVSAPGTGCAQYRGGGGEFRLGTIAQGKNFAILEIPKAPSVTRLNDCNKRHKACTRQRFPNSNTLPRHCHRIVFSERGQAPLRTRQSQPFLAQMHEIWCC